MSILLERSTLGLLDHFPYQAPSQRRWRTMKSHQQRSDLVVFTVQERRGYPKHLRELHGDLKVRLVHALLVAVHSRRGNAWIDARGDAQFPL